MKKSLLLITVLVLFLFVTFYAYRSLLFKDEKNYDEDLSVRESLCLTKSADSLLDISAADEAIKCKAIVRTTSEMRPYYSIVFPQDWEIELYGAGHWDILFNKDSDIEVRFHSIISELPLEQIEELEITHDRVSFPVIGSDERIIYKSVGTLGDKEIIKVETVKEGEKYNRMYFKELDPKGVSRIHVIGYNDSIHIDENVIEDIVVSFEYY